MLASSSASGTKACGCGNPNTQTVVSPRERRLGALAIQLRHFDAQAYKTVLQLTGASGPVAIEL